MYVIYFINSNFDKGFILRSPKNNKLNDGWKFYACRYNYKISSDVWISGEINLLRNENPIEFYVLCFFTVIQINFYQNADYIVADKNVTSMTMWFNLEARLTMYDFDTLIFS